MISTAPEVSVEHGSQYAVPSCSICLQRNQKPLSKEGVQAHKQLCCRYPATGRQRQAVAVTALLTVEDTKAQLFKGSDSVGDQHLFFKHAKQLKVVSYRDEVDLTTMQQKERDATSQRLSKL